MLRTQPWAYVPVPVAPYRTTTANATRIIKQLGPDGRVILLRKQA